MADLTENHFVSQAFIIEKRMQLSKRFEDFYLLEIFYWSEEFLTEIRNGNRFFSCLRELFRKEIE